MLAAERTYAAWVRTALAALVTGVGAKALLADILPDWFGSLAGSVLILYAGFCLAAAVWPELNPGPPPPVPTVRRLPIGVLLAVNGVLILVDIAALIGVWIAKT